MQNSVLPRFAWVPHLGRGRGNVSRYRIGGRGRGRCVAASVLTSLTVAILPQVGNADPTE